MSEKFQDINTILFNLVMYWSDNPRLYSIWRGGYSTGPLIIRGNPHPLKMPIDDWTKKVVGRTYYCQDFGIRTIVKVELKEDCKRLHRIYTRVF